MPVAARPKPASARAAYAELLTLMKDAATLASVGALLGWDQETCMPHAAAPHRADQAAMLSAMVHQRLTSPRVGDLIAACEADPAFADPDSPDAANIREMRRDFDRATRLPTDLVAELARVGSQAQETWKQARATCDFALYAPILGQMISLVKRKAECLRDALAPSARGELYNALLDEYEPGITAAQVQATFAPLRARLAPLIAQVAASPNPPDPTLLQLSVPPPRQEAFARIVLAAMGFDLNAGRLDLSTHPFCSGLAPGDTRLTFRYAKEGFLEPLYGVMHEAGHGLYEQGLPKPARFGQPLAEAISLGFHESQSRMWENFVGRSREFWLWAFPHARATFGPVINEFDPEAMFRAANIVRPSFIRVEADEATYNLHVMLRFDIERSLISGDLAVLGIPAEWNRLSKDYLGLVVPDDRRGCLQDVHWSFGAFGYFPTYTLGNLYAAQLWEAIHRQLPRLPDHIAAGEFAPLKVWLNTNIHAHGKRFRSAELCQLLTGQPLSGDPLMRHLESKLHDAYRLR